MSTTTARRLYTPQNFLHVEVLRDRSGGTSITFPFRRMPAVSTSRYVLPPRSNMASIESRVVPGTSLTIDRVSPKSRFRRLDLVIAERRRRGRQ